MVKIYHYCILINEIKVACFFFFFFKLKAEQKIKWMATGNRLGKYS